MPNSVAPRVGVDVTIKGRAIPFSFHPVTRSTRRYGLQSRIFATNPWGIIRQSIEDKLVADSRLQALAFIDQAENFYSSAKSSFVLSAKPLLFYYCFLNLAKAFCLVKDVRPNYEKAMHGLQEAVHPGGMEFDNSFLKAFRSTPTQANIFADLRSAMKRPNLPAAGRVYDLKYISPQLLQGHRVWCEAAKAQERFVEIHKLKFRKNDAEKKIWLSIQIVSDDLTRLGITQRQLLDESGLALRFRRVHCEELHRASRILEFEQIAPVGFTGRAADKIKEVVDIVRPFLWSTVTIFPPYRKHYVYLCPAAEKDSMMPQVLSVYGYFYYLGSITRYRPHLFDKIMSGAFGAHISEVISNLPQQFLYTMASEFSNREIVHAPIVS